MKQVVSVGMEGHNTSHSRSACNSNPVGHGTIMELFPDEVMQG